MRKLITALPVLILVSLGLFSSQVAWADEPPPPDRRKFTAHTSAPNMVDVTGVYSHHEEGQVNLPAPGESRVELGRSAPPPSADMGCGGQLSAGMWSGSDLCPYRFYDDEPAEDIPPVDLLYHALAQTQVRSAGLKVEPWIRTYVGVPTLVHASMPTRQEVVRVFEHDVVVDFEATSFKYDFGDGSPALVTTDPSSGFPVMTLNHVYLEPREWVSVVLETTWKARVVHPVTGERV